MTASYYDSEDLLSEYLLFHYGKEDEVLPYPFGPREALHFPVRCVSECLDSESLPPGANALDLGCAVGRSSFELARHCEHVIGIDKSANFVAAAAKLANEGRLSYSCRLEGESRIRLSAEVPPDIPRGRVEFRQGDALDLPRDLGAFDVVLAANLIDRLPRPRVLLERLPGLVKPGGQLILASPYTWLEEFTPRDEWLGGFQRGGHPVSTLESLQRILSDQLVLTARKDLPFLIREHARKYQWGVSEASIWRRK